MKIEFLYFDDCPNHEKALALLKEILRDAAIDATIERIEIKDDEDAVKRKFVGSPTIRINGVDIQRIENDHVFGRTCRTYVVDGAFTRLPSRAMIENALRDAVS